MGMDVVLLAVHGMGHTEPNFADKFEAAINKQLGADRSRVYFDTIFYQSILQPHQSDLFRRMKAQNDIDVTGEPDKATRSKLQEVHGS